MFRFFSKNMTYYSNHLLDWSRMAELLMSDTHRYSMHEWLVRGSVISFAAISGGMGAILNNEEVTGYSDFTVGLAAGFMGFVVSHLVAISPLILKRYQMSQDCYSLITEIHQLLEDKYPEDDEYKETVKRTAVNIMTKTMGTETRDNASLTWGTRKHLLEQMKINLENSPLKLKIS